MITLTKRLGAEATSTSPGRVSIRDKLLVKEVQEMESTLPAGCKVKFEDPNALHDFTLVLHFKRLHILFALILTVHVWF